MNLAETKKTVFSGKGKLRIASDKEVQAELRRLENLKKSKGKRTNEDKILSEAFGLEFPVKKSKKLKAKKTVKKVIVEKQEKVNKQKILRDLQEEGCLNREELFTKGHALCKEITKFDAGRAVRHFIRNGETKDEKIARSLLSGNTLEQTKSLLGLKRIQASKYEALLENE